MHNADIARLRLTPAPNRPKFYANSRTPDVIAMLREGHNYSDIATKLGVTKAYIANTSRRYLNGQRRFTVEGLSDEHLIAIWRQAEDIGCTVAELARAYIIDGIEDETASKSEPR